MPTVVRQPGEDESLFGGRIAIKAAFDELCITESHFKGAGDGAAPHFHRHHADSFYVLEGELAFLLDEKEHLLGPGACVCAPAGLVHGFRTTMTSRFLNFHTPDGDFAANLRARDRGEPGGFDSIDVAVGTDTGIPWSGDVLLHAGKGERLEANNRVATIKIGREELCLVEFELSPEFSGSEPHTHDDHVVAFYVLEGEVEFRQGTETIMLGPESFLAAPPGVLPVFTSGPAPSRLLNIHAPSTGFHEHLRTTR